MIDLTKFTHEQNQAILEYGYFLVSELKTLAEKSTEDKIGIYMSSILIQTNLLTVQTKDFVLQMRGEDDKYRGENNVSELERSEQTV